MAEYATNQAGHWGDWRNAPQRNLTDPTELRRIPRNLRRPDDALKSAFPARFPRFRLLVFFSLLPPGRNARCCDNWKANRNRRHSGCWEMEEDGGLPGMAEFSRHRAGQWADWHSRQPRKQTEPHGALKNPNNALKSALFLARFPYFLFSFCSLVALSQHLMLRQMDGISKPPTL